MVLNAGLICSDPPPTTTGFEPGSIDHLPLCDPSLENDSSHSVQAFFYPRYSYTESGAHACTAVAAFASADVVFPSDPVNQKKNPGEKMPPPLRTRATILTGCSFAADLG